jgi:hypothetical protein
MRRRVVRGWLCLLALCLCFVFAALWIRAVARPVVKPTAVMCPAPTGVLFAVEPVTSPTRGLTQSVTVRMILGEAVTITSESGVLTWYGSFDDGGNPARVIVPLITNTTHHLRVRAYSGGLRGGSCLIASFTAETTLDRDNNPLTIVQVGRHLYLPLSLSQRIQ